MTSPKTSVQVENLTIKFGDFTAVNNISFSVQTGEIYGFLGANGAGKTTTIRMLCGLLEPTTGQVEIADLDYKDGADAIKKKVGYMSQKFTLYNDLTVIENLAFTQSLRKLDPEKTKKRIEDLFKFIDFHEKMDRLVRDLPGGIKQELSLVAALLHDPEIIFLDEPTAGVSPVSRMRFWKLINQLSDQGKTVFVTTHYMDEAEECDRIALMRTGEIIAQGSPDELKRTAFPDLLVELTPTQDDSKMVEKLKPDVDSLVPYGRRYHATVRGKKDLDTLQQKWGEKFQIRQVTPTLEDVFIRLVEGIKPV